MYNRVLEEIENPEGNNEFDIESHGTASEIKLNRASPKKLYEYLTKFVIQTTKSINENSNSAIYIIDPQKNNFTIQNGNTSEFVDSISLTNQIVKKHLTNKKKFHQKEYPKEWSELFFGQSWRGSECAIFSPVNINGSIAGFIMTRLDHFNKATDKEIDLFSQLAEYVSFSLSNLESLEQHMVGEDSKTLILEILSNLDFKSDIQNIFNQFKYLIRTFFKYDRATISIRKESENRRKHDKGVTSTIKLVDGDKDEYIEGSDFPTNGSLQGLPVISGTYFQTNDWRESHHNMFRFKSSESDDYKYRSVMGVPIIIEGESRGSIILEKNNNSSFSNQDLADAVLIGQVLGSALHWKYEYEKIHKNATHDGLTGLLNHQTFKERFNDEVQRAARFQQKMAVMMFDLDKFKKVNDTLGHQYGDYVIQTVAKIMIDSVRAVDVVARYGGEEFAVILINTTAVMSNIVAQRIVDTIADYKFSLNGVDTRLSISGGMSEYPTHADNMRQLIEIADQEMYATKKRGGNGITIHQIIDNDNE
tara:strand:- start:5913 stop:7511 length:1599 start_codon:yes stop_codon:yes gene_type:complete